MLNDNPCGLTSWRMRSAPSSTYSSCRISSCYQGLGLIQTCEILGFLEKVIREVGGDFLSVRHIELYTKKFYILRYDLSISRLLRNNSQSTWL